VDLGRPFEALERTFTDPDPQRFLFLCALIGAVALLNHEAGITHHYDLSYQIEELERLDETAWEGSTPRLDSLRSSIVESMREWRNGPSPQNETLIRALTGFPILMVFLSTAYRRLEGGDDSKAAMVGIILASVIFGGLFPFLPALVIPNFGDITWAVVVSLCLQCVVMGVLGIIAGVMKNGG
jgi:VIT1/CCC1 family predicted Fe2+/Mn2+ transporter